MIFYFFLNLFICVYNLIYRVISSHCLLSRGDQETTKQAMSLHKLCPYTSCFPYTRAKVPTQYEFPTI